MANSELDLDELDLDTQYALSKSDDTPSEVLHKLACSRHTEIKRLVASNPNTSREDLLWLSESYGNDVYQNVAFSVAQREDSEDRFVQLVTARSTHVSPKQLEKYAKINREDILIAVGRNRLTPAHVLEGLVLNLCPLDVVPCDEYSLSFAQNRIFGAIAANPNTPIQILRKLSEKRKEPDGGIYPVDEKRMTGLASNPNTPTDILENILKRYERLLPESVLTAFIENPVTPYAVLKDLAYYPISEPSSRFHYAAFSAQEQLRIQARTKYWHFRIRKHPNAQAHLDVLDKHFASVDGLNVSMQVRHSVKEAP